MYDEVSVATQHTLRIVSEAIRGLMHHGQPPRLLRAFSFRVLARLLSALLQGGSLLLLARSLGPADFGRFVLGISLGAVLASVTGLGGPTRALRINASPGSQTPNHILHMSGLSGTVNALIVGIIVWHLDSSTLTIVTLALLIFSDQFTAGAQAVFAGMQRQSLSALIVVIQRLVPTIGATTALFTNTDVLAGYAIGLGANSAVCVAYWWMTPRAGFRLAEFYRSSKAYWAATWTSALANLDISVLRLAGDGASAGIYGAATRLVSPLNLAVGSLITIIVPAATHTASPAARNMLFNRATKASVVGALVLSLFAPFTGWLVEGLLGSDYERARWIVTGVMIGVALSTVSQLIRAALIAQSRVRQSAIAVGSGTVFGLIVLALLARLAPFELLALAPIITQGAVLIALLYARRASQSVPRG